MWSVGEDSKITWTKSLRHCRIDRSNGWVLGIWGRGKHHKGRDLVRNREILGFLFFLSCFCLPWKQCAEVAKKGEGDGIFYPSGSREKGYNSSRSLFLCLSLLRAFLHRIRNFSGRDQAIHTTRHLWDFITYVGPEKKTKFGPFFFIYI